MHDFYLQDKVNTSRPSGYRHLRIPAIPIGTAMGCRISHRTVSEHLALFRRRLPRASASNDLLAQVHSSWAHPMVKDNMFETIVLRRAEDGQQPSIGDLAEAMLFYRRVHLIIDRGVIFSLARSIGIEQLIVLLKRKQLSAVYCRDILGTQTQQFGALAHHSFVAFEMAGRDDEPRGFSAREGIELCLRDTQRYSGRQARKLSEQLLELMPVKSLGGRDFVGAKGTLIVEAATADVYDIAYLTQAVSRVLEVTPGFNGLSRPLELELQATHAGFTVFSNLNLEEINDARLRLAAPQPALTVAHFLTEVFTARAEIQIAAHYGADFKTSRAGSALIDLRHQELLRRSGIHNSEIRNFQQVLVNEGRSLKEVIDSGERSFSDFLDLLDRATAFRNWSGKIHPDASLVAEYLREVSREGWLGSLPGKGLRFVIGSGLDLVVAGLGTVFGAADSLLLDKMSKGWRPNHFVDTRLKPFVNDDL